MSPTIDHEDTGRLLTAWQPRFPDLVTVEPRHYYARTSRVGPIPAGLVVGKPVRVEIKQVNLAVPMFPALPKAVRYSPAVTRWGLTESEASKCR